MKVIGLIGGMSWRSSLEYYRIINEAIEAKLGGFHSAKILMFSVDFDEIDIENNVGGWSKTVNILIDAAKRLEEGRADFILLCANTMHKAFGEIQKEVKIPVLHIVDATADKIKRDKIKCVGLLGTKTTMNEGFYKERLIQKFGLKIIIPGKEEQEIVHNIINDLCLGKSNPSAKNQIKSIIANLASNGAEGVILGCTELSLIIQQEGVEVKLFDTTKIHAEAAVEKALGG